MKNKKILIIRMPIWLLYFSWIGIIFEIVFSYIIIPLYSKDYISLFPVDIANRTYNVSRIWDIVNLIIIFILIYAIFIYYRKKIIVEGDSIKVYPVIGKEYTLTFKDIKSAKRITYGFVEEITIKTINQKKFSTENMYCGYYDFCKLIIENTNTSIREGFEDIK